jgi:hypothetical protein
MKTFVIYDVRDERQRPVGFGPADVPGVAGEDDRVAAEDARAALAAYSMSHGYADPRSLDGDESPFWTDENGEWSAPGTVGMVFENGEVAAREVTRTFLVHVNLDLPADAPDPLDGRTHNALLDQIQGALHVGWEGMSDEDAADAPLLASCTKLTVVDGEEI